MASTDDACADSSQEGSDGVGQNANDDLFLTAVDVTNADGSNAEGDFFDDIGYNQLVADLDGAAADDDDFARLQVKVKKCRKLQRVVDELRAELAQKQEQNALTSKRDAAAQKESDNKMEQIRQMEETATKIENSAIPLLEKQVAQLEAEKNEMKARVEAGPGWSEEQNSRRTCLSDAIDQSRSEATERGRRLSDLRAQLASMEKEVEASIKRRDESLANIDELNGKLDDAHEQVLAAEQQHNEAERSKGILAEALRVAKDELADLEAELDGEKQRTNHCEQKVLELQRAQQTCADEYTEQAKGEDEALNEINKIRVENTELQRVNQEKQRDLEVLSKERADVLKERAKASKLLELVETKSIANEKDRSLLQNQVDELNALASKVENEIPLARKEAEVLKREIRKAEQEYSLVTRKVGLSQKETGLVLELARSNESTLLIQQTELNGIQRAVGELQKTRQSLVEDESRDEDRLQRIFESLQSKRQSLRELEQSNRSLESSATDAEEKVREQHKLCEVAREEHNMENKSLIVLRDTVHQAKTELVTLMTQMKSIKEDISRADEYVFREHRHHHHVDLERQGIESDIARFCAKTAKLEQRRSANDGVIAQLGNDIDQGIKQRDLLRQKYRTILLERDTVGAHLVATEAEHRRINEAIGTHATMNRIGDTRYRKLTDELEAAKAKTNYLLARKECAKELGLKQRARTGVLAALEQDLSRQVDKNSAVAVEIGRPVNLHRWRYLRDKSPDQFAMLEKLHALQRKTIVTTDRIAKQSCDIERQKLLLSDLREDAAGQQSVDDLASHLSDLKLQFQLLSHDLKANESGLLERIDEAEGIKQELVELEQKRMQYNLGKLSSVYGAR